MPYGARAPPGGGVVHRARRAGRLDVQRGPGGATWDPGGRVYHPSDAPHASATPNGFVLAAWVWWGDIAYDSYHYTGQGLINTVKPDQFDPFLF